MSVTGPSVSKPLLEEQVLGSSRDVIRVACHSKKSELRLEF